MALPSTPEDYLLDDGFIFSAFEDAEEEIFPISDEEHAEALQLEEALYFSAMSTTSVKNKVIAEVDSDTSFRTFNRKRKETHQSSLVYCGICMDAKPSEEIFRNQNCSHSFCDDCIGRHVAAKVQENISKVKCPDPKCKGVLEPQQCRSIIPKEVFNRWEKALCENLVVGSQKFYCPFKDCSAMLICDAKEVVTSSECPHCHRLFCAQCKVSWHAGIGCREFRNLKGYEREKEDLMVREIRKKIGKDVQNANSMWKELKDAHIFLADVAMNFAMPVDPLGILIDTTYVYLVKNWWRRMKLQEHCSNVIGTCY